MPIQVSEQHFYTGKYGQESKVPSNVDTLKRTGNCFLMGGTCEGEKAIVTTDQLSPER